MKLITPEGMRAAEAAYFHKVSSFAVMDRAAKAVADCVQTHYPWGKVAVLCGPGNNGGDGYGAAAYLKDFGRDVTVYETAAPRGDAAQEKQRFVSAYGRMRPLENLDLAGVRVIVDALLGIGFSRAPEGLLEAVIRRVNESGLPVVSVDVPTGMDAGSGKVPGVCLRAAHTVTFAFAKPGHFLYPAREFVGQLHIASLGLEEDVGQTGYETLTHRCAASLLPPRPRDSHKGSYGYAVVAAGSRGMMGAGSLASEATLRAGCGKTTWIHPGDCAASPVREVMTCPVGHHVFGMGDEEQVLSYLSRAQALCIGPGTSRHREAFTFIKRVMRENRVPFVMDADALMAYAARMDGIPKGVPGILTPHVGEAAALLGCDTASILSDPVESAKAIARASGCVAVLKGASTIVTDANRVTINATGNPGMATAGAGDVLSGIMTGFLAQGMDAYDAARLSVYVHGLAGDLAAQSGARGMTAGDILACVRPALHILDEVQELSQEAASCP